MPKWLDIAKTFAPMVLSMIPQTQRIAGVVASGIAVAEQIPGATGAEKKALVLQIASLAAQGTNAQAGRVVIDPAEAVGATGAAIDATVSVINIVHKASPDDVPAPLTSASLPGVVVPA